MISGRVQASLAYMESEMPRGGPVSPSFYNVEGDRNVTGALIRQLNLAAQEIVVDVWREEASLLRSELEQAELRGVKLLWAFDGGNAASAPYPIWPPLDGKPQRSGGGSFLLSSTVPGVCWACVMRTELRRRWLPSTRCSWSCC